MEIGDTVDDFELADQNGVPRRLSEFTNSGPVVIFFYPAAMSAGCTVESKHFRDKAEEFVATGASRIGISGDTVEKQKQFDDKHQLGYPLLSDADGSVSKHFGVGLSLNPMQSKRKTFVVDQNRILLHVVNPALSMKAHADEALKFFRSE